MSLFWRDGCEGIFLSGFRRSLAVVGCRERVGLNAPRIAPVGDFVLGSGIALA